jgi:hypothetical protein
MLHVWAAYVEQAKGIISELWGFTVLATSRQQLEQ